MQRSSHYERQNLQLSQRWQRHCRPGSIRVSLKRDVIDRRFWNVHTARLVDVSPCQRSDKKVLKPAQLSSRASCSTCNSRCRTCSLHRRIPLKTYCSLSPSRCHCERSLSANVCRHYSHIQQTQLIQV